MESNGPLRVLIAENHRDLSDVVRQLIEIEPDMQCVGQVSDAADVLAAARASAADVIILDLMLHGGSGLPLVQELADALPQLRDVVFSGAAHRDEIAREAKRRGAAAFVPKGADFQVLMAALRPQPAELAAGS